jgi:hypothetical protein
MEQHRGRLVDNDQLGADMSEVRLVRSQSPHDAVGLRSLSHPIPNAQVRWSSAGYRCRADHDLSTGIDKSPTRQRVQTPCRVVGRCGK